jgi:c-di-GMP-binding flagellar brake protein YcgR
MRRDKRVQPRIQLELKLSYVAMDSKVKSLRRGVTRDISKGGVRVETDAYDPTTEEVKGRIRIPGEDSPIDFIAKVAWSKKLSKTSKETGLQFTKIKALDKKRLEKLIKNVWLQMITFY